MHFKAQEIQNIFGEKIESLNIYNDKEQNTQLPTYFLGKITKDSRFVISENKITSAVFFINEKETLDLIEVLIKIYKNPNTGIEKKLIPANDEKIGTFGFGKVSSKDFVFDKTKLQDYMLLVWNTDFFVINFYNPNTVMNDSKDVKIELFAKK